ncbi:hypothetical protein ACJIZ3_018220 [Penstemon smallii]|uniref:U-box domain-containing protein n=1 Tax=Penstemon smallii TaxID=265156 RepID=A0ABD3SY98_9LAMI
MVRDDLYITVPSYFRCPISLDVMKSPVSLSTGVTYDRSSIQRWLEGGNNTCPATMQVLQSKELVPNHTLHRLIQIWLSSVAKDIVPNQSLTSDKANELIHQLETQLNKPGLFSPLINQNISKLISFADVMEEGNGKLIAKGRRLLPSLLSFFGKTKDLSLLERIISLCNILLKNEIDSGDSIRIDMGNRDFKESVMVCLKQGRLELRIAVVKFLELMASHLFLELSEDDDVIYYSELLRLISTSNWNNEALEASLCLLIRLVTPRRNRVKMVKAGGVKVLATVLSEAELSPGLTEKVLKLVETASGCKEGRNEICGDEKLLGAIVKKVLKVSDLATEYAVTVMWSLCCLFGDKRAVGAVVKSNGMGKILVLLQSNCSPAVRQMCGDLLRVLRGNGKTSCLSCYDTKTTHIMPF